jgi:hypothetical protein
MPTRIASIKACDEASVHAVNKVLKIEGSPQPRHRRAQMGKPKRHGVSIYGGCTMSRGGQRRWLAEPRPHSAVGVELTLELQVELRQGDPAPSHWLWPLYRGGPSIMVFCQADEAADRWPKLAKGLVRLYSRSPQGCSMKDDTICDYICRLCNGAWLAEPGTNVASIYFEIRSGLASRFACSPQRRIDPHHPVVEGPPTNVSARSPGLCAVCHPRLRSGDWHGHLTMGANKWSNTRRENALSRVKPRAEKQRHEIGGNALRCGRRQVAVSRRYRTICQADGSCRALH